ncbi:MAG: hypothetical protein NVS2B17_11700 [Candidatus Velthaea sp.]
MSWTRAVAMLAIVFIEAAGGDASSNELITNEYAFHNPSASGARVDSTWEVTSGSLFARYGSAYTGIPDHRSPNADSSNGTNSAVFRCRTKKADFGDVSVEFNLRDVKLYDRTGVGPHSYDGVHVWVRYQSEYELYAVTVNRRDGLVVIKKKTPGGASNGGSYFTLAQAQYRVPFGATQHVRVVARNLANGSVTIVLQIDGLTLLQALDAGTIGGAPIVNPGRLGIRGDNSEFYFDAFKVTSP